MDMSMIKYSTKSISAALAGFMVLIILLIAISCRPTTVTGGKKNVSAESSKMQSLIKDLKDQDPKIRLNAAQSLYEMGDAGKDAIPALIGALKDPYVWVVQWSARALGHLGPSAEEATMPLLEAYIGGRGIVPEECRGALAGIGEPAIRILFKALENPDTDVRQGASYFFAETVGWLSSPYGEQVTSALLKSLDDKELCGRGGAAKALASNKLIPDLVIPKLISMLAEKDWDIREDASKNLAYYGPSALPALGSLLFLAEYDGERQVRVQAIETIGAIGPAAKDAVPRLLKLIDSPEQGTVIRILTKIGPEQGVLTTFLKLLRTGDEDARSAVADNIYRFGPKPEIVSALINALKDKSPHVITYVTWSLQQLGSAAKPALPALRRLAKTTNDKDIKNDVLVAIRAIEEDEGKKTP
jgi:HEAT repeat protein